jgi:integrase/recombinase XerD
MDNTTIISLTDLIHQATQHLGELNYSKGTTKHYTLIWGHLQKYAKSKNCATFTLELGYEFLESKYGIKRDMKLSTSQVFKVRSVIILYEFMHCNEFQKCHQRKGKQSPNQFSSVLEDYLQLQREMQLSRSTIEGKSIQLINFLLFISQQKVNNIVELCHRRDIIEA